VEPGATVEINLTLALQRVETEITVESETEGLQLQETTSNQEIAADTLTNAPLVSERFLDALPLVPGVVRGVDGLVRIKGARSTQSGWLVNSANVTDPVTGEQAITLPIDVIEEIDVLPNPYAAEYGKFAGAVTAIETKPSADKFRFSLNNFIPRARKRNGKIRGIESATPRLTFSGPLLRDRLSFLQSFEYRLSRNPVTSLPELEQDSEQRGWMAGLRDHYIFDDGSLLESTVSLKDFDVDVFPATAGSVYILRPERNFGSFFNSQNRISRRYELLETYSFSPKGAGGQHQLKLGFAYSHDTFRATHRSIPVEVRRADDTLAERIEFLGEPFLDRDKDEFTFFFHDKWNASPRLTLDLGLRYDRDTLAEENNFAPRLGFAYVLTKDSKTLLRGGAGLFYDKVPLNVGTFEQLQRRVVTRFEDDGVTPVGSPLAYQNQLSEVENPRNLAFNLELNRDLGRGLLLRLGYLQREGRDEYIVEPFDDLGGIPTLLLASRGRSRYREFQVTANYHFREDNFLNISYVHSESAGDLNNFQEFFGNFDNPIIRENAHSRLQFDVPDRLLIWGEIGLLWGIRWAPVLDVHTGFAFSLVDEEQNFVGARNHGGRFPAFANLDSQVFKDFQVKAFGKKRRVRVGVKLFNILKHFNPRDVQQNIDAVNALGFFNSRGRLVRGKFFVDF
jgi:outer membrane receptor protein involved in Fe transport